MSPTVTTTQTTNETDFFADILTAIGSGKNEREILVEKQPVNLIERLNRMIALGTSFDVAADDFQIVHDELLQEEERKFLTVNKIAVLCTLQQALLMKHLFQPQPDLLTNFIAKVNERDARFEDVCEITTKWFARLLDTMPDRNTTL